METVGGHGTKERGAHKHRTPAHNGGPRASLQARHPQRGEDQKEGEVHDGNVIEIPAQLNDGVRHGRVLDERVDVPGDKQDVDEQEPTPDDGVRTAMADRDAPQGEQGKGDDHKGRGPQRALMRIGNHGHDGRSP